MKLKQMLFSSPEQTKNFARKVAALLKPRDIVILRGELGAGKTLFVQGLAEGLGVSDPELVRSPTFTLIHEYQGKLPLFHFDFYRLENVQEALALGLDEYFEGEGVSVIEWGNKFPTVLPERAYVIELKVISEAVREIILSPNIREKLQC
ncbi:MAG: tRNA (adenosine(37)-N6)-threonylcarbamoyltransferase complex ATPase subunit type 1 TsaE [Deltaproteobacteria bacterium RIFCSPLOWO2_02_FULL_44_10]|nr:MAG: tRNA (adenosine(37)-N6)-threonylcarbamoyltransferase complex ATPase subunit type 1 TsaE [Deltaproteobacteria bacterium RIFCSPHIGHO2_02_FULL_44_16]OGQ46599.1 MAG: tRNA (adenosine(37)-N6)-threonylcarbamoyltransferase complex ATPase subunit type 1 TsaE [Deltaproteobacteria bacterium RIFCSPLOWO2_02_FULL_44_10]